MMPLSRTARWPAAGAAVGGLAILVAACGSVSPSASGGPGASGQTSTSSRATPAALPGSPAADSGSKPAGTRSTGSGSTGSRSTRSGSGGTAGAPAGGIAACASAGLRVAVGARQGTAGSVYADIDFTNVSAQRCTLYGYPGVSFVTGTPARQVGLAAAENPVHPRELVTLAPGAVASAVLQVGDAGNYTAGQCRPRAVSELRIYPPNQTASLLTGFGTTACAGPVQQLHVEVVQPGASSS